MISLSQKTEKEKKRFCCPFYGFAFGRTIFLDTKGNQCALIPGNNVSCKMEKENQEPNWNNCPYKDSKTIINLINRDPPLQVSPNELQENITFKEWYKYVMGESLGKNL